MLWIITIENYIIILLLSVVIVSRFIINFLVAAPTFIFVMQKRTHDCVSLYILTVFHWYVNVIPSAFKWQWTRIHSRRIRQESRVQMLLLLTVGLKNNEKYVIFLGTLLTFFGCCWKFLLIFACWPLIDLVKHAILREVRKFKVTDIYGWLSDMSNTSTSKRKLSL